MRAIVSPPDVHQLESNDEESKKTADQASSGSAEESPDRAGQRDRP
jgi:hypothetical protein